MTDACDRPMSQPAATALHEQVLMTLQQHMSHELNSARIWLAFSGGLDSTVLLHCLCQRPEWKARLTLLHVHHGLSPNADAWQQHCCQLAQQYHVPIVCHAVTVDVRGQGLEAAARQARYDAFLQHVGVQDVLLTAHHADDQLETFLQRWLRGAGLFGLGAMPVQRALTQSTVLVSTANDAPQLLRPLLSHSRAELEAYAQQQQLSWIHDESNDDNRWTRNWWRNELLPRIWARYPQQKASALRAIEQLQHDQQVLSHLLQPYVAQVLRPVTWPNTASWALDVKALYALDEVLQPYVVRAWWQQLQLPSLSQQGLQQWLQQLQAKPDRQPSWPLANGVLQRHQQQGYWYRPIPSMPECMPLQAAVSFDWAGGIVRCRHTEAWPRSGYTLIGADAVVNRSVQPYQRPRKTFKQLFQEHQVPPWLRAAWPVIVDEQGQVACVVGLAVRELEQRQHPDAWQWSWDAF